MVCCHHHRLYAAFGPSGPHLHHAGSHPAFPLLREPNPFFPFLRVVAGIPSTDVASGGSARGFLSYVQGMVVLVGDGMKQAKEARRMPGVKKLHQESENSSKADYIFGHLFGAVGILMGTLEKWF